MNKKGMSMGEGFIFIFSLLIVVLFLVMFYSISKDNLDTREEEFVMKENLDHITYDSFMLNYLRTENNGKNIAELISSAYYDLNYEGELVYATQNAINIGFGHGVKWELKINDKEVKGGSNSLDRIVILQNMIPSHKKGEQLELTMRIG